MADQDKDLPLVVSEILIEMHELNSRFSNFEQRLGNVEQRLGNVESLLAEVVDNTGQTARNIQQLSSAINRMAEVTFQQQQENNRRFELLQEADKQQSNRLERTITSLDNRLERLENKQYGTQAIN